MSLGLTLDPMTQPEAHHAHTTFAPAMARLCVRAHAKVNLFLSVGLAEPLTSARPGWHKVSSLVHSIDVHDDVVLTPLDRSSPSDHRVGWMCDDGSTCPADWPIESDLGVRALRAIEDHIGRAIPVAVCIRKRIPAMAGLGGGSSDAAAVLLGINELFDLRLSHDTLLLLATKLGSDVAFFVDPDRTVALDREIGAPSIDVPPRPACITGFGQTVERLNRGSESAITLIVPPFGCATPDVYAAFDRITPASHVVRDVRASIDVLDLGSHGPAGAQCNDLEDAACVVNPQLGDMLGMLRRRHVRCFLTGSGSGIVAIRAADDVVFEVVSQQHRPLWRDVRFVAAVLC